MQKNGRFDFRFFINIFCNILIGKTEGPSMVDGGSVFI